MFKTGSPEWFFEKSLSSDMEELRIRWEEKRSNFIKRFSPEKLAHMNGKTILEEVFGNGSTSMLNLLMSDNDDDYIDFGSIGKYTYLGVLYKEAGSLLWTYNPKTNNPEYVSNEDAAYCAEKTRDQLVDCVDAIEDIGVFSTIEAYENLRNRLKTISFFEYPWAMKYYQMLYPQYFPGMYAKDTMEKAIEILGLTKHPKYKKLVNAGEISLFIRRCDVNNIVFNKIYGDEWKWPDKDAVVRRCESADENYINSRKPVYSVSTEYYNNYSKLTEEKEQERAISIKAIDEEIATLGLVGKEIETLAKRRENQGVFRNQLLEKYGKCCVCGVKAQETLISSHIKPWSVSMPKEKLDPCNGLLLCPNHDKLFDIGLISFDDTGRILISDELSESDRELLNVHSEMQIAISERNKPYLKYHRDFIFRKTE